MSLRRIATLPFLHEQLCRLAQWRIGEKLHELLPYVSPPDRILDVGSGNCVLCYELSKRGYRVTALDVANVSFIDSITPVIYDGVAMPFDKASFDVVLLITMLHHTPTPERVLMEAKRVARRIIVIEEIYAQTCDKYLTYFIDSVFNLEFFHHPHTNKTDAEWRDVFKHLGLQLVHAHYSRSLLVLKRVTYVLEQKTMLTL